MPDWKPTPKQALFVQEYLKDNNGAQGGHTGRGIAQRAPNGNCCYRLLTNANIKALIENGRAEIARSETMLQLTGSFRNTPASPLPTSAMWSISSRGRSWSTDTATLTPAQAAAIGEIAQTKDGIRIKLNSKQAALDSLSRTMGMFRDKLEVEGNLNPATLDAWRDIAKARADDISTG